MFSSLIWVILGMAVVTYLPRLLPLVAIRADAVPPFLQGVLKNIPFAVLGALILPSIFIIHTESLLKITIQDFIFGLIGGGIAFVTAYLRWNIIFVVLSAIGALVIYTTLISLP